MLTYMLIMDDVATPFNLHQYLSSFSETAERGRTFQSYVTFHSRLNPRALRAGPVSLRDVGYIGSAFLCKLGKTLCDSKLLRG